MTYSELYKIIKEDLRYHGGNTFISIFLILLFNMSFRLVLNYRLGFFLAKRRNPIINIIILILKKHQIKYRNCDISYHSNIGRRIKFPHPLSIIIGDKAIIGDDVMIWQEVTLGSHGKSSLKVEYPVIEDRVKLFSGCKIIGKIRIGNSAIVAANAVVLNDVNEKQIVAGVPAKQI